MSIATVFLVIALVCFVLAAMNNIGLPVQLGWAGLAFYVLSLIVGR
jgi:hypothetical protein